MIFPALLPPPGLQPIKITQTTGMDPSCETKPEITSSELASIIKAMSFFFTCDLKAYKPDIVGVYEGLIDSLLWEATPESRYD
jgi:hypothetical protein